MTNDLSNDLSCFENRKDLVLIHLALSAEAHAQISGCPVNLFSRCFTVTANKRWKLFSFIFKLFLFLASCLSLTWLEASTFSPPPSFLQWLQLISISGAAAIGTQALATSILDYPNRLFIGLPDSIFSLSDPSYYCWQTGVPKYPLIMSHLCTQTFSDSLVTGMEPIVLFLHSLSFILGPQSTFANLLLYIHFLEPHLQVNSVLLLILLSIGSGN